MARKGKKLPIWSYVIILDSGSDRDLVIAALDADEGIINWYSCMGTTVFVQASEIAEYVADIVAEVLEEDAKYLVMDAKTDKQGRLPKRAWDFLNEPDD